MKYICVALIVVTICLAAFNGCDSNAVNDDPGNVTESSTASYDTNFNDNLSSESPESSRKNSDDSSEPESVTVDAEWFDDAVFIGDSVTLKLSYYADNGSLGKAEFLCQGSLGYGNALWDLDAKGNVHPSYEGKKYTVDEGAKMLKAKKIFIMFGMNDIGLYGIDDSVKNMKKLTERVAKKNPDAKIYIQSVTPMLEKKQLKDLNNKTIDSFNEKIKAVCDENGYSYLDVASIMKNEEGSLKSEYCSDPEAMGIHFSDDGCKQWVDYLKKTVGNM